MQLLTRSSQGLGRSRTAATPFIPLRKTESDLGFAKTRGVGPGWEDDPRGPFFLYQLAIETPARDGKAPATAHVMVLTASQDGALIRDS